MLPAVCTGSMTADEPLQDLHIPERAAQDRVIIARRDEEAGKAPEAQSALSGKDDEPHPAALAFHSHSIVPGGLEVMS